jgi:quinol monooxygenase YgiN
LPPRTGGREEERLSVTRINQFHAREGEGGALKAAIESFLPSIRSAAGNLGCRLLQGEDDPDRVVVIEEWEGVPDHRAAAESIPAEALEKAKALLAEPPRGGYFKE